MPKLPACNNHRYQNNQTLNGLLDVRTHSGKDHAVRQHSNDEDPHCGLQNAAPPTAQQRPADDDRSNGGEKLAGANQRVASPSRADSITPARPAVAPQNVNTSVL